MSRFSHSAGEPAGNCRFRQACHFYNIRQMTPHSARLKEAYCVEWPEKCAIYVAKATGKPVSITLWPAGKLKAEEP